VIVSFCTAYFCSRVFLRTLLVFVPRAKHAMASTRLRWLFGLEARQAPPSPLPAMAGASEARRWVTSWPSAIGSLRCRP
jgi:hypothetical protein